MSNDTNSLLSVRGVHAAAGGKPILKGLDLEVKPGEVHAIMGPNGSGKSTLARVLTGHESAEVTAGEVLYKGQDLFELAPEERAREGMFLAFQYPVEIPGIANSTLLREGLNAIRDHRGESELDAIDFLQIARAKADILEMDHAMLSRAVNYGFSGGEKKRNEVLQMLVLEPTLAILDETDSGLDIDALKIVAKGVNALRAENRSFIVITHYQRLLDYIVPDVVHVLADGRIAKSGDKDLALELEAKGYAWLEEGANA
ncbi:MAG: Fe-S cluster assembly ATPase SufC [Planctomycetota bacterium]|nr:Fe-S cluster assembly ATPase SufC [Planctomycetota bacterium]